MVAKVAHVVAVFPPYKAGIGNAAYNICWELLQRGWHVDVFTTTPQGKGVLDASMPFRVHRLRPWIRYGNAAFIPQLIWKLRSFDIVHLHYPFFGGAEMVFALDLFSATNVVVHYHMDVVGEGIIKRVFNFHTNHVMPRILKRAEKVIVTTMDYARASRIQGMLSGGDSKFIEIPLGVNTELFKPRIPDRELITRYDLTNKQVVLFVGALDKAHYFKGVNYLIKAFQLVASNNEYRLMIVGGGNLTPSYKSIVANFGLERKVIFTGIVPDDVLPRYYNLADIFVLPSIDSSEAFGIALLEAMASGVPVIASDLPGVRRIVARNESGYLVKPKHIDTLAKQMSHLLKNPQVSNRFGKNGRARVMQHYTWERVGQQVHDLYQQFVS